MASTTAAVLLAVGRTKIMSAPGAGVCAAAMQAIALRAPPISQWERRFFMGVSLTC